MIQWMANLQTSTKWDRANYDSKCVEGLTGAGRM